MTLAANLEVLRTSSHFVIGGARSGKTRFGLTLAEQSHCEKWMIVTAQAADDEMRERISNHRAQRDISWSVVEEPWDLVAALKRTVCSDRVVVVDCLTLWLSNLLLAKRDIDSEINKLVEWIEMDLGYAIFISNELGLGLVPDNVLGRSFRDWHGTMNQAVAASCGSVTFIAAGLPLKLK